MRNNNQDKVKIKLEHKLHHFDNLVKQVNNMNIEKLTKENVQIFATNSLLQGIKDLTRSNKLFYEKELKSRHIYKYIKIRNVKQLIKKLYLRLKYQNDINFNLKNWILLKI